MSFSWRLANRFLLALQTAFKLEEPLKAGRFLLVLQIPFKLLELRKTSRNLPAPRILFCIAFNISPSTLLATRIEFCPSGLHKQDETELLSEFTATISIAIRIVETWSEWRGSMALFRTEDYQQNGYQIHPTIQFPASQDILFQSTSSNINSCWHSHET